jgi:hypothetical protein
VFILGTKEIMFSVGERPKTVYAVRERINLKPTALG